MGKEPQYGLVIEYGEIFAFVEADNGKGWAEAIKSLLQEKQNENVGGDYLDQLKAAVEYSEIWVTLDMESFELEWQAGFEKLEDDLLGEDLLFDVWSAYFKLRQFPTLKDCVTDSLQDSYYMVFDHQECWEQLSEQGCAVEALLGEGYCRKSEDIVWNRTGWNED